MIWALLFSLLFSGGSDMGSYSYLGQLSVKESKEIISQILVDENYKDAIKLVKSSIKEIKKAEKDINKIYMKLDNLSNKKKMDRVKTDLLLKDLELRHSQFYQKLQENRAAIRLLFTSEEWNQLIYEVKSRRKSELKL
jgi:hypothetical protein